MKHHHRLIALLFCVLPMIGQAGGFGKLPISARAVSLGGRLVALQDDPNVLFSNPSGISGLTGLTLSTSYTSLYHGISDDNISYLSGSAVTNLGWIGNVGVGLSTFRSNNWKEGTLVGSYAMTLFEGLSIGANAKLLYWSAGVPQGRLAMPEPKALSSSTISFDAGVQLKIVDLFPENDLIIGASMQDLMRPSISMDRSSDARLPLGASLGVAYISRSLEYLVQLEFVQAGDLRRLAVGVEIVATRGEVVGQSVAFIVRGGASTAILPAQQGDLTGGIGLEIDAFRLDYAFGQPTKIQALAGNHHVSLRYSF